MYTTKEISELVRMMRGISYNDFHSKSRLTEICEARQIAMYLCCFYKTGTQREIGMEIGRRDHATVLHARRTMSNLYQTDKNIKQQIDFMIRKIEGITKPEPEKEDLSCSAQSVILKKMDNLHHEINKVVSSRAA
jgi:tRNA A-37 threonylcarbamoyl transferase component Bud32